MTNNIKINLPVFRLKKLLEWMDAKINQSRERVDTYNRVEYSCRENLRINAAIRQRRVEAQRRNLRKTK